MTTLALRPCFALAVIQAATIQTFTLPQLSKLKEWPNEFEIAFDERYVYCLPDLTAFQNRMNFAATILIERGYKVTVWEDHFKRRVHMRGAKR